MEVPKHWRLQKTRYGLVGDLCLSCKAPTFPPRDICLNCTTEDLLKIRGKNGTIYECNNSIPNTPVPIEQVQH